MSAACVHHYVMVRGGMACQKCGHVMGQPERADDAAAQGHDRVWIPAVPLPFLGWRTDRCKCGQKFRGKNRRAAYELHYRRAHQRDDRAEAGPNSGYADMEVTRAEARRIYAEVNADSTDGGQDRVG